MLALCDPTLNIMQSWCKYALKYMYFSCTFCSFAKKNKTNIWNWEPMFSSKCSYIKNIHSPTEIKWKLLVSLRGHIYFLMFWDIRVLKIAIQITVPDASLNIGLSLSIRCEHPKQLPRALMNIKQRSDGRDWI